MNDSETVINLEYFYSLAPDWMHNASSLYRAVVVENKLLSVSNEMAFGNVFFSEIIPEISVIVFDITFKQSFCFSRLPVEGEFWILYYNLSSQRGNYERENGENKEIEDVKVNFAIMDSRNEGSYPIKSNTNEFSLRILISKDFVNSTLEVRGIANNIDQMIGDDLFFSSSLDRKSIQALLDLKKPKLDSPHYNLLVNSTAYNLIAYFFENQLTFNSNDKITVFERDREAIVRSQEYLLSDLTVPFPGIENLVKIANMSVSKYRRLYKILYGETPVAFFRREKMKLAKRMIESESIHSLSELAFAVGYVNVSHFTQIYKKQFGSEPDIKN